MVKEMEKGKEYDYSSKLIFEGVYLNDERNGKGEEFNDNGILIFEVEYLNGIQWIGKNYDEDGNKILEINNTNGKGKEYYYKDKIKYEGEYENNLRNGKGKEYYHYGILIYEGEYQNQDRHGKGKEYDLNVWF